MLLENTKSCPLSFRSSPSLTAVVASQSPAPEFPCCVSRDNVPACRLPRRTKKMDVHVYKVALSNLRKIASEKYCSHHDY